MGNVLELASEDVALALGHEDGGELVRMLYCHRDRSRALQTPWKHTDAADDSGLRRAPVEVGS